MMLHTMFELAFSNIVIMYIFWD